MSITGDDIRAAVGAGKISEAQATAIVALADARRGARENLDGLDEPFELFKGFNEIFIVVGLTILFVGWCGLTGVSAWLSGAPEMPLLVFAVIGMAVLAALAGYFTKRRRMVAPSIALSIMFAISALQAGWVLGSWFAQEEGIIILAAAVTTLCLLGWWGLFRIPFALLLVALGAYVTAFSATSLAGVEFRRWQDAFLLSDNAAFAWVTLAMGLLGLVLALRFDMSDPHRVTRRTAQAFWLHVISAPAIVNTVAFTLFQQGGAAAYIILSGFLLLMALFAIVIDRRSFLISGIGYVVALVAIVAEGNTWAFILLLGVFLVALGAFWESIRGAIMAALPRFPGKDNLPPWTRPREFSA
ncbi:hypothetical protein [Vannielia litorea]|uniref:DUF2157 domain-containing protein n=1 Tax=Vannielia litorea TaxID=1217970 RepID=A0A1N6HK48_9RHOB|nr:hypothetical protein [Vannielia litorea]SIO20161.1 hypothetical protein SAMN05444002_3452 [Vannielia litorea]